MPLPAFKRNRSERVARFKAFLHNHWLGLAVFGGVVAGTWGANR